MIVVGVNLNPVSCNVSLFVKKLAEIHSSVSVRSLHCQVTVILKNKLRFYSLCGIEFRLISDR